MAPKLLEQKFSAVDTVVPRANESTRDTRYPAVCRTVPHKHCPIQNVSGTRGETVPKGIGRGRCGVKFKTRWAQTGNDQKQTYVETQGKGWDCKRRSGWESMCISFLGLLQFPVVS